MMGHHVISTTTEGVLLGLTELAGAVMIAALVTPFISSRTNRSGKHLAFALFEVIVVVISIISALVTAESALTALYEGDEVNSSLIGHIAWPLVLAVTLLLILAIAARLVSATRDGWTMGPWFLAVAYVALAGGFALDLYLTTNSLIPIVGAIVVVGASISWTTWYFESRSSLRLERIRRRQHVERLLDGHEPIERALLVGVPGASASGFRIRFTKKDGRLLLHEDEGRRIEARVAERWRKLHQGEALLTPSDSILTEFRVERPSLRPWQTRLDIHLHRTGQCGSKPIALTADARGNYFDITDLGVVQ
jgi:hypothetical protein